MDASPCLLQRFDDLHRRGRTVRSEPLHDPIRLLTVGFALIAPTGWTRHDMMMGRCHIKACLTEPGVAWRQRATEGSSSRPTGIKHLAEAAVLKHLQRNVRPADEFTVNVDLRHGGEI